MMCKLFGLLVLGVVVAAVVLACAAAAQAAAVKVEVVKQGDGWQLMRDGKPYFIKGVGGDASKTDLVDAGGNSFRTWGVGNDTPGQLDQAQKLGLTVTLGIWLGQAGQGFNYNDAAAVARQLESAKASITKFKDHPALLISALGNEMEGSGDNVAVWKALDDMAVAAKKIDPNHPTMTVIAEMGGQKVHNFMKYCPNIDILGINSYAGCSSVADRYKKAGGTKPYVVTEFGPPGVWEWQKNDQGAGLEPNSSEKAAYYKKSYLGGVANQPLCLGSYAFLWGSKQETTATWFGMILPDGNKLECVDVMAELWSGKPPAVRAPQVKAAKLDAPTAVAPGTTVKASAEIVDPQGLPLTYKWVLSKDSLNSSTGGAAQAVPPSVPGTIAKDNAAAVEVKMPADPGAYRLFLYAYNGKQHAATANFPIKVSASAAVSATTSAMTPEEKEKAKPPLAKLPFAVYSEGADKAPYSPTGFMPAELTAETMKVDAKWADNPHSGKTCMKITYDKAGGWGGIVWQNPDDDWGKLPGGYNLTGAKVLTFWARGDKGGEVVSFGYGLLADKDKFAYFDTSSGSLKDVVLTKQWHPYFIYLDDKDLSRIKSPFQLIIAGGSNGNKPVTIYLDDIQFMSGEEPVIVAPKAAEKKAE